MVEAGMQNTLNRFGDGLRCYFSSKTQYVNRKKSENVKFLVSMNFCNHSLFSDFLTLEPNPVMLAFLLHYTLVLIVASLSCVSLWG